MRKSLYCLAILFCFLLAGFVDTAFADEKDKAIAMVKKAVAYNKANGIEKTIDEANNPKGQFTDGELYVFIYDLQGVVLSNPNPLKVGQNLLNVPDDAGKFFRKEIITTAMAKGNGWVDYMSKNPKTKEMELKTTYFEKVDEYVFGCGIYKHK
jgi:cytochrome c